MQSVVQKPAEDRLTDRDQSDTIQVHTGMYCVKTHISDWWGNERWLAENKVSSLCQSPYQNQPQMDYKVNIKNPRKMLEENVE